MQSFRETLRGPAGKSIAVVAVVVGLAAAIYGVFGGGGPDVAGASARRWFVDAESNRPFQVKLHDGEAIPVTSPFSGKATGVPAELCYWNPDGTPKTAPDAVLLNWLRRPPVAGPTFCPVCHRLVVGHNPEPDRAKAPPPTEAEYRAQHGG